MRIHLTGIIIIIIIQNRFPCVNDYALVKKNIRIKKLTMVKYSNERVLYGVI